MTTGTGDIRGQVEQIVDFFEGGLSDQPNDRGGLTKFGITLDTLKRLRPLATADDLKRLDKDDAIDLLTEEYALKPGFAKIQNDAVRFALIDFAINSGPVAAIRALQKAIGVPVDGVLGHDTQDAANRFDIVALLRLIISQRLRYLGRVITTDPRQAKFAAGWLDRVATILEAA